MMNEGKAYYLLKEASEILNIRERHLYELSLEGRVRSFRDGELKFEKDEIDSIKTLIDESYSFKEVVQIITSQPKLKEMHKASVRNYMDRFETKKNPLDGKDTRFYKRNLDALLQVANENFKTKITRNKVDNTEAGRSRFQQRIDNYKGKLHYLAEENLNKVYDFDFIQAYTKEHAPISLKNFDSYLRYMINACKKEKIQWYTNNNHTDFYINKADFERYKKHKHKYAEESGEFNSDRYYTTDEVKKILGISNVNQIYKFKNGVTIDGKVYIEKDNVYEMKRIFDEKRRLEEEAVPFSELVKEFGISYKALLRFIEKLNISYILLDSNPLLTSHMMYKTDLTVLEESINHKRDLENATSRYERFYIEVSTIRSNVKIPQTLEAFDKFIVSRFKENGEKYVYTNLVNVYQALIPQLEKEIMEYTMEELILIVNHIPQKVAKTEFSYFVNFVRGRYETKYKESFKLDGAKPSEENEAYTFKQWLHFGFLLFTEHEKLLPLAIESRMNAMVWLYCSMHYVCGWRTDDIINLPAPNLMDVLGQNENEVLDTISNGEFTEAMSQRVVSYSMMYLKTFGIKPKKTRKKQGTSELKFVVEESYMYTIGMLIALCEAHRIKVKKSGHGHLLSDTIMTGRVVKRDAHISLFGEQYHLIFGEDTFLNQRATKTYINFAQVISMENKWGSGYNIGSFIRSHAVNKKKGYAQTTQVYLESINKSNDVDKVSFALTERGSFGFITHMMTGILSDEGEETTPYALMSWEEQTGIIKEFFGLNSFQIEGMIKGIGEYQMKVSDVFQELLVAHKDNFKEVLMKLSVGDYPSKMEFSQCLLKTINRSACAYPLREHCIGCEYALNEMFFLIEFNHRLEELLTHIRFAEQDFDKQRYTYALFYVYLPVLHEAIAHFGKERVRSFVQISGQEIRKLKENNQLMLGVKN